MDVVAEEPAADADAADGFWEKDQIFPRVKERDAYRRLGISDEASFEEVQDARNYLVQTYARHTAGVEAIEEAFDKYTVVELAADPWRFEQTLAELSESGYAVTEFSTNFPGPD